MNISIFDVVGPVMIGPSSSHTAGAARLARVGRMIAAGSLRRVAFGLSGSFAKTCKGHGTDRALVAGALGLHEDDERLADSFTLAAAQGLDYQFYETELDHLHENSVQMRFETEDGRCTDVVGSSIGGGRILIHAIDGFETEFSAQSSTLIIRQNDQKGIVSKVSGTLAAEGINIAVMRLGRTARGGEACTILEVDGQIPPRVVDKLATVAGILSVRALNIEQEGQPCTTA